MFISAIVFRSTLGIKSTLFGASVFKNTLQKCVIRRFTNFRVLNENSRTFWTCGKRQISFTRFNKSRDILSEKFNDTKAILNNVIIFKFERPTAITCFLIFAVVQLFGMLAMANNVYNTFCRNSFKSTTTWRQRFAEHPFSLLAIICGCTFGPVIFFGIFFITSRTIRRIILHKGGEKVTFVTYSLIPSRQVFTELLENVSCKVSRIRRSTLPLSIKGRSFYYFVDTDGEIVNEDLFDYTVGMKRDFYEDQ